METTARLLEKDQRASAKSTHSEDVTNFVSPPQPAGLHRKAACPCDGGCVRCQAEASSLALNRSPDLFEEEAEAAADKVMQATPASPARPHAGRNLRSNDEPVKIKREETGRDGTAPVPGGVLEVLNSAGKPMDEGTRTFMESRFDRDFSQVKIHDDNQAAASARSINALAYTSGNRIAFASGQYDTNSHSGKRLLAHELTHVVQQRGTASRTVLRTVDDAQVEKEFGAWADANKQTKDKKHRDFPWAVWEFISPKIVDNVMVPLPKPKNAKQAAEWEDNFSRAEIVARWLFTLKGTTTDQAIKDDADTKANFVLTALAQGGFVSKAMAQSGYLSSEKRASLYDTILQNPSAATASELEAIVKFQCNGVADPASVPIVITFTDSKTSPLKSLPADKTKAIFGVLAAKYGSHDVIVNAIAEVLMFNPGIRKSISDAMMASAVGTPELLFKVLRHKFFLEPEYGAQALGALVPAGMSPADYDKQRMKTDMPWVYLYKQKYYVDYLIDLAKGQKIVIPKPTAMTFSGLKTWLDANTEKIGEAAKAKYPSDSESVFEIYRNIADIFFYHVPHDRNVDPDLEGKIGHLKQGAPSKMRFEADCDVFATYAMRLFSNAGFEPIGYMAYVPIGSFKHRAAHVSALLRKDGKYSIINNKGILDAAVSETKADEKKEDALKSMREKALSDAYADPIPTDLKLYYQDAGPKGQMSQKFKDQDSSLERPDLL